MLMHSKETIVLRIFMTVVKFLHDCNTSCLQTQIKGIPEATMLQAGRSRVRFLML